MAAPKIQTGDFGGSIDITYEAAAAISQFYCVKSNGTDGEVQHTAAVNETLFVGVAQTSAAADGDKVRVRVSGVTMVKCGGTCTFGTKLSCDTTVGTVIDGTGTHAVVGVALADGADGDIIPMVIHVGTD
jgi:hypothetical protein